MKYFKCCILPMMVLSLTMPVIAAEGNIIEDKGSIIQDSSSIVELKSVNCDKTWSVKAQTNKSYTSSEGSWILLYDGKNAPARRKGETVSAGSSVGYSHSYSGSLQFPIKGLVQASLGYSFGDEETFQAYKTSASLDVGEYVKAYYKKTYLITPVDQIETTHTYGYETVGGMSRPVNKYTSTTYKVNGKKAIMPVIDLKYYKANARSNGLLRSKSSDDNGDILIRTETYEFINGHYKLTNKTK